MQKLIIIPFVLVLLTAFMTTAFAEQALVPQSGQVLCYDAAGAEIPCAGTGQDGEQQMGVPWPTPRFTDNGNGTVTDNLTGLIWLKNANCYGSYNYYWSSALNAANTLASSACGLTDGSVAGDWRLPNRKELESLINRQQANSAAWLNSVGFSNVTDRYWTSSAYSPNPGYVWLVRLSSSTTEVGSMSFYDYIHIWPVRGGQ